VSALNASFASGRVELTIPFSRKFGMLCQIFVKKTENVPCCRRRIGASFDQTPGLYVHRVTRISDTTYAVVDLAGICLDKRPDSPPAGRKTPCFFTNILHTVQNVCEKAKTCTMLPQAILPFTG
jgi:hypothetical protein